MPLNLGALVAQDRIIAPAPKQASVCAGCSGGTGDDFCPPCLLAERTVLVLAPTQPCRRRKA